MLRLACDLLEIINHLDLEAVAEWHKAHLLDNSLIRTWAKSLIVFEHALVQWNRMKPHLLCTRDSQKTILSAKAIGCYDTSAVLLSITREPNLFGVIARSLQLSTHLLNENLKRIIRAMHAFLRHSCTT